MPGTRASCARRRIRRAVRLVRLGARAKPRPPGFPDDFEVETWQAALTAMQHCQRMFPDFFNEHLAARMLTPQSLFGACAAFLSLVHRDYFPVSDWCELLRDLDPVQALATKPYGGGNTASQCLAELGESSDYLRAPRPEMYGIGVRELIDGENEDIERYGPLTIALWHMADRTSFSLGLDLQELFRYGRPAWADVVFALPQLPPGIQLESFCDALGMAVTNTEVGEGCIVAYAFGDTGNPVADFTAYEVTAIHGGFAMESWERAGDIAALAREAQRILYAYRARESIYSLDPAQTLPELAGHLCAVARTLLGRPARPPKSLAALFGEDEDEPLDLSVLSDVPIEDL